MTLSWSRRLLWGTILVVWSALIVAGLTLIGNGLIDTFYIWPTAETRERARIGGLLILAGSVALFVAAAWARWMYTPIWACLLVISPAVLAGGLAILFGDSLLPQLSALVTFPVAFAGLISGLILARPLLRQNLANSSDPRHPGERHAD